MERETTPGERVAAVLGTFDAAAVHRAVAALPPPEVAALARVLAVPRRLLQEDAAAARVLRRRTLTLAPSARPDLALMLVAACNDDTIAALGDRHEDPTREDMLEVLDAIVETHGRRTVALMLAAYVDGAAPCAAVFADLLDTDERFSPDSFGTSEAPDENGTPDAVDEHEAASEGEPGDPSATGITGAESAASVSTDAEKEARRRERKERERAAKERRARQAAAAEAARKRQKELRRRARG